MVEKVRIGPIDFSVRFNSELGITDSVAGRISTNVSRIEIDPNLEKQRRAFVLLHEILHGILIHGRVDLGDNEESIVDILAMGVVSLIRDNPELIQEIQTTWEQTV